MYFSKQSFLDACFVPVENFKFDLSYSDFGIVTPEGEYRAMIGEHIGESMATYAGEVALELGCVFVDSSDSWAGNPAYLSKHEPTREQCRTILRLHREYKKENSRQLEILHSEIGDQVFPSIVSTDKFFDYLRTILREK